MPVGVDDRKADVGAEQAWAWPPDVLAFAREAGVADYLQPLLEETRRLFPEAPPMRVKVEADPEIENLRHIACEIDIPYTGTSNYLKAQKSWIQALCRVCPAPLTCVFCLLLMPVTHGPA